MLGKKSQRWYKKSMMKVSANKVYLLCPLSPAPLRWVESSAWFLILSSSLMRRPALSSKRPRRRGLKSSWAEPPQQWYKRIMTRFCTWLIDVSGHWTWVSGYLLPSFSYHGHVMHVSLMSICLGTQTQTYPGVPTYPAVPKEPWWGGWLLQSAESSQTAPYEQVQESRYEWIV